MTPDDRVPPTMVDALYYVDETANTEDMDALLSMAAQERIPIEHDPESSCADVAMQLWLARPDLLERHHAETTAFNHKSFMVFAGREGGPREFPRLTEARRLRLQEILDDWFAQKRRGRGSRVFAFPRGSSVWLMVRHGQPMRREGRHHDDGQTSMQFYRPQQHDVLIYDGELDELSVHTNTKGERDLYLRAFGTVLFDDEDYFPRADKFTLEPLVVDGPEALQAQDIDGIDGICLTAYQKFWGGKQKRVETQRATDIYASFGDTWRSQLAFGRLTSATFKLKFTGSTKERSVTIRPPNIAKYERDDDSGLVEEWLRRRGFCKPRHRPEIATMRRLTRFWRALDLVPGAETDQRDWVRAARPRLACGGAIPAQHRSLGRRDRLPVAGRGELSASRGAPSGRSHSGGLRRASRPSATVSISVRGRDHDPCARPGEARAGDRRRPRARRHARPFGITGQVAYLGRHDVFAGRGIAVFLALPGPFPVERRTCSARSPRPAVPRCCSHRRRRSLGPDARSYLDRIGAKVIALDDMLLADDRHRIVGARPASDLLGSFGRRSRTRAVRRYRHVPGTFLPTRGGRNWLSSSRPRRF